LLRFDCACPHSSYIECLDPFFSSVYLAKVRPFSAPRFSRNGLSRHTSPSAGLFACPYARPARRIKGVTLIRLTDFVRCHIRVARRISRDIAADCHQLDTPDHPSSQVSAGSADESRHASIQWSGLNMKRNQYYLLLVPALVVTLLAVISFFYSWRYHSMYLSAANSYEHLMEKLKSLQCLAPRDLDFILGQVLRNHQHTQDTADMFFQFGSLLAAIAILVAVFVHQASKRLTYKGP
jgi:hypothetical protein